MADNNSSNIAVEKQQENSRVFGRPFPPGVSGNPNGRPPKGTAITDVMKAMLNEKPEIKKALAAKLYELALGGDLAAIREVLDRIDGKPKAELQLSGDPLIVVKDNDSKPITMADPSVGQPEEVQSN